MKLTTKGLVLFPNHHPTALCNSKIDHVLVVGLSKTRVAIVVLLVSKNKHTQTSLFARPNGYKAGLITTLRYLIFIRARFITTGGAQGRNASQGFGINPKDSDGYRQNKIHMDVALADLVAKALQLKMLLRNCCI